MSKNVFDKIQDVTNRLDKNTFDWSHANNFTAQLGKIVPVFCEQLPAGSSIRIKPTFGLKFMPMMFPIQSRMKAYLSFFRVPLRALWTDYADFISSPNSNSDLVAPYISGKPGIDYFSKGKLLGISGLADNLGVPVTYSMYPASNLYAEETIKPIMRAVKDKANLTMLKGTTFTLSNANRMSDEDTFITKVGYNDGPENEPATALELCRVHVGLKLNSSIFFLYKKYITEQTTRFACLSAKDNNTDTYTIQARRNLMLDDEHYRETKLEDGNTMVDMYFDIPVPKYGIIFFIVPSSPFIVKSSSDYSLIGSDYGTNIFSLEPINTAPLDSASSPYYSFPEPDNINGIKLSAYPFRAYECIYNGYMRNIRNNPFMINGKPVYNRFIPNSAGGADEFEYQMYSANWASDCFTTAVPSPQQGTQPLVGLTTYTETVPSGSSTATVLKTALVDEDGNKYKVSYQANGSALTGVSYEKLDDSVAVSPISSLYNLLQSGISINDFRNVNAYQRYLELNMFKGYSYRQIVEGRFDCTVHYDTLLLPEYLGGITRDVTISPITQTVEINGNGSYNGALGSQAGNAICFGDSEFDIKGFCDEESIVMGLLTVVPMPIYTQPIPKFFLYRDRLDTFNPEFDHIGYQPIYTQELCPVNQWIKDKTKMKTVFGYQRPWYEYVQKRDTAHGLFRTELRNFIMNRVFDGVPELGKDFTTVDVRSVNDVFSVTEVSDKILGQVYFDCTAKLPISRVVVPRLE